jgi:hypothetical protein
MLPSASAGYGPEDPTRSQQDPRRKVLSSTERGRKREREPTGMADVVDEPLAVDQHATSRP